MMRQLQRKDILQWVDAWDDPDVSYEFDVAAFARTEDGWYFLTDAGCSCYMPWDQPPFDAEWGPGTIDEMAAWLEAEFGNDRVSAYYKKRHESVMAALETIR